MFWQKPLSFGNGFFIIFISYKHINTYIMSFTLRTFTENSEVNNYLGDQYEIVMREESYNRFSELYLERFGKNHVADLDPTACEESIRCYAFVINEKDDVIPVFKNQKNYIVTSSGKTFDNITHR